MRLFRSLFGVVAASVLVSACGGAVEEDTVMQQEQELSYCKSYTQGGWSSCKPTADWKLIASNDCASKGLRLATYTVSNACGAGLYRQVDYTCCP